MKGRKKLKQERQKAEKQYQYDKSVYSEFRQINSEKMKNYKLKIKDMKKIDQEKCEDYKQRALGKYYCNQEQEKNKIWFALQNAINTLNYRYRE
jgi:hypothetical protein